VQGNQPHPVWRSGFALYKWLVVVPVLLLSTFIIGLSIVMLSLMGFPDLASRLLATRWARLNLAISMIAVEVDGKEKVNPQQSYVIAANHQSLIDIYVLYGCSDLELKWVMKQELRSVPVLGLACQAMGHIYIDRSNTEAALASINKARSRIWDGISIAFFPEGTRSRTGELATFKKGAFRLAQELGLPILPVAIHDTNKVLPSDTLDLHPGTVRLEFLDPITTGELTDKDVNSLAAQTRQLIQAALDSAPNEEAPARVARPG